MATPDLNPKSDGLSMQSVAAELEGNFSAGNTLFVVVRTFEPQKTRLFVSDTAGNAYRSIARARFNRRLFRRLRPLRWVDRAFASFCAPAAAGLRVTAATEGSASIYVAEIDPTEAASGG